MKTVSISELKAHLSQYLAIVSQGTEVQILDRGVPIARLIGSSSAGTDDEAAWVDRLVRSGLLRSGTGSVRWLLEREPIAAHASIAQAIEEDREDRI